MLSPHYALPISIPNNWGGENPNDVVGIAVLAEELGFDSIWTAEHLLNSGYVSERIGDRPYYHGLCTLAYVAAKTTKIALGTSVVVLPFRSEEHTSELQSLMRSSYAVFFLKKKNTTSRLKQPTNTIGFNTY